MWKAGKQMKESIAESQQLLEQTIGHVNAGTRADTRQAAAKWVGTDRGNRLASALRLGLTGTRCARVCRDSTLTAMLAGDREDTKFPLTLNEVTCIKHAIDTRESL
jgi:hypothetical protein